jgi:hypothetical protein
MNAVIRMLPITLACGMLTGCGPSYTVRPTEIAVTDYQTSQPAPNLDIRVFYSGWLFTEHVPSDVTGRTDQQGKVELPIADFKEGAIHLKLGDPWAYYLVSIDAARHGGEAVEQGEEPLHHYRVMLKPVSKSH